MVLSVKESEILPIHISIVRALRSSTGESLSHHCLELRFSQSKQKTRFSYGNLHAHTNTFYCFLVFIYLFIAMLG
jgi:hypothetical protein